MQIYASCLNRTHAAQVRQEYVNRVRPMDAEIYPLLLYYANNVYEGNVWRGLLKGHRVVRVRFLFIPPLLPR